MAKARQCSVCGNWYNPKFAGNDELCSVCLLKEIIKTNEQDIVKQEVKMETPRFTSKTKPAEGKIITKKISLQHEYEGLCKECGEVIQGIERFDRELGWIIQWKHSKHPAWYCLAV